MSAAAPAPPVGQPNTSPDLLHTRYIYPLVLFLFFIITLTVWGILTSESSKPTPPPVNGIYENGHEEAESSEERPRESAWQRFAARFPGAVPSERRNDIKKLGLFRKAVMNWLLAAVLITFVGNSANVILHALMVHGWWCGRDYVISTVALLFVYALLLIVQVDDELAPSFPHFATWIVGFAGEALELAFSARDIKNPVSTWEAIDMSVQVFRMAMLLVLIALYVTVVVAPKPKNGLPEERTGLLANGSAENLANGSGDYGSLDAGQKALHKQSGASEPGWARKTTVGKQSWWEYLRGYTIFFPYLWPSKDRRLQVLMIICFILVLLQRWVNVMVPDQLGKVTDILSGEDGPPRLPWDQITLYIVYRFLQGNMGLLGAARSALWVPIGQYSYQALSTSAFEHVHSLSLDFHLGKKTGEVLSALSKGNAINSFLEQVSFQVAPMLIDLGVAVIYFLTKFDSYYALIVGVVTLCYLYLTVRMAQWRADIRREMVNKSREEDAVKNDSMIAYETVKYFNAESYEFGRYSAAVQAYQKAEYRVLLSLNVMNVTQNVVFTLGLLIACYLCAYQVTTGEVKVGRFVALLTYLAQLQGPLNFFGTFYRSIQSSMINAERMLELFKEKPTVTDTPEAKPLPLPCQGEVTFDAVAFSYDTRKPALRSLSFTAPPGTTTAFVGESGGGKTTILRLLFRFYNPQSGSIRIDGHDVRDVTIDSVRQQIGVVPQDTVLFNETVMYNLKYANPGATDEDVFEACRAAAIHERILSFPDGYQSRVGERGLRLSGGEKQRVAIARTILKNPKVMLLDEASAQLDTETEGYIQAALKELAKGRTTLVIAHRLSTIVGADQILVVNDGRIVERGNHEELLGKKGRYWRMWEKQVRREKVAMEKKRLEVEVETPEGGSDVDVDEEGVEAMGQNVGGAANDAGMVAGETPATRDAREDQR